MLQPPDTEVDESLTANRLRLVDVSPVEDHRLTHRFDGYLMKIHHQGYRYKVYRKLQDHTPQLYSFVTP